MVFEKNRGRISPMSRVLFLGRWLMGLLICLGIWYATNSKKQKYNESLQVADFSTFRLRHIHKHGVTQKDRNHHVTMELDVHNAAEMGQFYESQVNSLGVDEEPLWTSNVRYATNNPFTYNFNLKKTHIKMPRLVTNSPDFIESYLDHVAEEPEGARKIELEWIPGGVNVVAPNVTDKETIISLALMSSNAYVRLPQTGDWRNVTGPWRNSDPDTFGWESDGLRGHVFVSEDQNTVVLSFKGTSAQGIPGAGDGETTYKDKFNDNLLFSCCCARVSYLWTTVCDCFVKSYTCDERCLEKSIRRKDCYYQAAMNIYRDVIRKYPDANIWLTGHSLGGALASLVGRTFGLPTVAFEAPGELLAAKRLHLPMPPGLPISTEGIWHVGHNADPIFIGTCNGASSSCSIAGYAMETACHSGKQSVYDVVHDKGWHVNLLNHRIHTVIDSILNEYDEIPDFVVPEPCVDCYNWNFVPSRSKTTSKTTPTPSETTSTTPQPTNTTTTSPIETSSTCVARNWFGICTEYSTVTAFLTSGTSD